MTVQELIIIHLILFLGSVGQHFGYHQKTVNVHLQCLFMCYKEMKIKLVTCMVSLALLLMFFMNEFINDSGDKLVYVVHSVHGKSDGT